MLMNTSIFKNSLSLSVLEGETIEIAGLTMTVESAQIHVWNVHLQEEWIGQENPVTRKRLIGLGRDMKKTVLPVNYGLNMRKREHIGKHAKE